MHNYYNLKGKHLTSVERTQIERWLGEGCSRREIARRLGRCHQTVNNEVKQRSVLQRDYFGNFYLRYFADVAQEDYFKKHQQIGRKSKLTQDLAQAIEHFIKAKVSPEIIAFKLDYKISASTIYNWINAQVLNVRRKDLLYPHKKTVKVVKSSFKGYGQSIEARPDWINDRSRKGHWEIDTVILDKAGLCLLTLTERKTRYELIRLLPARSSEAVNRGLLELQKAYHFESITSDNGAEFARLSDVIQSPIYYAHPYHSWERGTNENHNRMIRRFLPKGCKTATPKEVAEIQYFINHYPRKMFDYKTSHEVF